MAATNTALNLAVAGLASQVTELSLHTDDPGGSGTANELTGGAYDREEVTYGSPSNGTAEITTGVVFGGPAAPSTVTHIGFWDDNSTFLGSVTCTNKTIGPGDTLTVTSAPITVSNA